MEEENRPERVPIPERKHNWITWMDGCDAAYWTDHLDLETGMRIFEFKPSENMKWKHQIQDHEYNPDTGRIVKSFPDELCINSTSSANSIRWFIFCDYHGKPTYAMNQINKDLLIKYRSIVKELQTTKMALLIAQREAKKRETHRLEADKELLEKMKYVKGVFGVDLNPGGENE